MHRSLPAFVDAAERVAEREDEAGLRWHSAWQYLVLHLEHCLARRSSGAAQAAQVVMIILVCMRSLVGPIGSVMQFSLEKNRAN